MEKKLFVFVGKDIFPKKRRILVLINPKSGNGASVSKFRKFVEPVFKDAGIYYQEFVTSMFLNMLNGT